MTDNPFAAPPACPTCGDTRTVTSRVEARENDRRKCPACGNYNDDEYERFRTTAWLRRHKPPEICELDLTMDELKIFKMMRENNPTASKTTVLMWMDGQRYDPSKDPEFLAIAREEFKTWRARA
jgi:hypothetical protein